MFLYHHCISRGGGRGAKMTIEEDEEDNVKEELDMVDYIKRNNDFKYMVSS